MVKSSKKDTVKKNSKNDLKNKTKNTTKKSKQNSISKKTVNKKNKIKEKTSTIEIKKDKDLQKLNLDLLSSSDIENITSNLEDILENEVEDIETLHKNIIYELKQVKELEDNILFLSKKVLKVEKLYKLREKIILDIFKKEHDIVQNKEKLKLLFRDLEKLDEKLIKLILFIGKHLEKLILNQTHQLYSKNEENKEKMISLNEFSIELLSKIRLINSHIVSTNKEIEQIKIKLKSI